MIEHLLAGWRDWGLHGEPGVIILWIYCGQCIFVTTVPILFFFFFSTGSLFLLKISTLQLWI